tara:strand:+ start:128 stop:1234 length:1107 start_codon:yes stop_codon:yes gene_type:complete
MKWIGQHIWDFISRFRSTVYLEEVSNTGTDVDKFLVAESDGKIGYRTGAQVLSDIGGASSASDVTGITITSDSGTANDTSGNLDISIVGGEGIDTSATGYTVTITGEDATTSNKGVASFHSDNFSVSSGAVTIKSSGVDLTDEVAGTLPVANGGTGQTDLANVSVGSATNAGHVSVADNESEDENNLIPFIEDASATGNVGLESDGDFYYNPSLGRVVSTQVRTDKNIISLSTAGIATIGHGDIVYFGGTTSMAAGTIYYLRTNGTWALADCDGASTSTGLLAVALGTASDTDGMLLRGTVSIATDPGDVGEILYISTTAGRLQSSAPSGSGDIVRVAGYKLRNIDGWNDDSETQIWFNPDSAWVEIA